MEYKYTRALLNDVMSDVIVQSGHNLQNSDFSAKLWFFRVYLQFSDFFQRLLRNSDYLFFPKKILWKTFRLRRVFSFFENYLAIICPFQHLNFIILVFLGKTIRFKGHFFVPLRISDFPLKLFCNILQKSDFFTSHNPAFW